MISSTHPEAFCNKCGSKNPSWHAPNELWNKVTGNPAALIICPSCFEEIAEKLGFNVHTVVDLIGVGINSREEQIAELEHKLAELYRQLSTLRDEVLEEAVKIVIAIADRNFEDGKPIQLGLIWQIRDAIRALKSKKDQTQ